MSRKDIAGFIFLGIAMASIAAAGGYFISGAIMTAIRGAGL